METPQHTIKINPLKTVLTLLGISLTILLFSLLGQRNYYTGNPTEKFFRELFTTEFFVNNGENISTYWNTSILIFTAVLFFLIASARELQKDKYGWWGLGIIFAYFAVDTLARVSLRFIKLLRDLPTLEDGSLYTWFYPFSAVIILLLILFFVWFHIRLDLQNKVLFPISICLYILGAYKTELFSGYHAALYESNNTAYLLITHAEEFTEYIGIILMIYLLLTYLEKQVKEMEFTP